MQMWPQDRRTQSCRLLGLDETKGLPFVLDPTVVVNTPPLRPMRDVYNAHSPMTMIFENIWLCNARSAWDEKLMIANGISTTLCLAPHSEAYSKKGNKVSHLPALDMNKITSGVIPVERLGDRLVEVHARSSAGGQTGVAVYCVNAANRSPLAMCAYTIARTGCSPEKAVAYVTSLRQLTDVRHAREYQNVAPMDWLKKHCKFFQSLFQQHFQDIGKKTFSHHNFPKVVDFNDLRAAHETLMEAKNRAVPKSPPLPATASRKKKRKEKKKPDQSQHQPDAEDEHAEVEAVPAMPPPAPELQDVKAEPGEDSEGSPTPQPKRRRGNAASNCSADTLKLMAGISLKEAMKATKYISMDCKTVRRVATGLTKEMKKERQEFEAWRSERDDIRQKEKKTEQGKNLLSAMQRRDNDTVELFLDMDPDDLDYDARDESGMTAAHHSARMLKEDWLKHVLDESPESANARTFFGRTPSQWTALNCVADTPCGQTPERREAQANISLMLIDRMDEDAICNRTGYGTTAIHQFAACGHIHVLEKVLPKLRDILGTSTLASLMNVEVGRHNLGAVDVALKCNAKIATLLKKFGGKEMASAPDNWDKQRRKEQTDSTHNARSHKTSQQEDRRSR
jgi:hypothetical protein